MNDRLTRRRDQRVLGGVCAGLGAYLRLDPTLIRVFFVLLALADGIGFLVYLALWMVVPAAEEETGPSGEPAESGAQEIGAWARTVGGELRDRPGNPQLSNWIGVFLILFGGLVLLRNLDIAWLAWLDFNVLWPLLLVVAGLVLLIRRGRD